VCHTGAGGLAAWTARPIGVVAKVARPTKPVGPSGSFGLGIPGEDVSRPITFQRRDRA
jgi:hypothetical protein